MSCRIVSLEEATKIYDRLDPILKVPSLSPEFVFADSFKRREYQPIFWLYQKKNDLILRSFQIVETRLSDNLVVKDIESAYGYGGVLASNNDKEFLLEGFECFNGWARQNSILAEFCRIHPLLENQELCFDQIIFNRKTVSIDLKKDFFSEYPSRKKSYMRKEARKKIHVLSAKSEVTNFLALYFHTMSRLGAEVSYNFSNDYFVELTKLDLSQIWFASYDGVNKAAIFLLVNSKSGVVEYHLGGYLCSEGNRPMEFLLHSVAEHFSSLGYREFFLGGGRSVSPDDTLLKFKTGFSNRLLDFNVGYSIFNPGLYDEVKGMAGHLVHPDRIVFYRD